MKLPLALLLLILSGCVASRTDKGVDETDSYWTEERKALYQQALEGARISRERYIATERTGLQRQFRQENPSLTDEEVNALVDEALERELRAHAVLPPDGARRQRQMDCMSPAYRNSIFTLCP